MIDDKDKYYWYIPETNTYLSKEESKPIIERNVRFVNKLVEKIENAYRNFEWYMKEARENEDKSDYNYYFDVAEGISVICMEFEEIIREYDRHND